MNSPRDPGPGGPPAISDLTLGERVALKTIRSEIAVHERANQRFRREVQLARKVTHPNICRIFDLFEHRPPDGTAGAVSFVTMELLQGETLSQHLRKHGPLSVEDAPPTFSRWRRRYLPRMRPASSIATSRPAT